MTVDARRAAERTPIAPLAIRLFGQVDVSIDGVPFRLATPRKSLQILAYVLLHRAQPVARDFLAFTLWPDDEEESALMKFRASFSNLQRVMPPGGPWIVSGEGGVRWNEDAPLRLDVAEFEAASADPERYREAVALYRGELLEALYDDWIVAPRERYCKTYLTCLEALLGLARRRRAFGEALDVAGRILEVDPWREDIVRRTIATRYDAGDRTGAIAEYRRFVERLRADLGVEPMPETVALAEAIMRGASIDDDGVDAQPQRPTSHVAHALPFVGRAAESQQLAERWARAERGHGGVVFITGEAGIGKSRQVLELSTVAEGRGGRILAGSTGSPEATAYQCIVEAFRAARPLLQAVDLPPLWASVLTELVPELASPSDIAPPLAPDQERARLFEAMARALAQLARVRPVLLVLEDVHWSSEATLDAIAFLGRQAAGKRILIAATYRDDEVARRHPLRSLTRRLTDAGNAETVPLAGLDRAAVDELLDASGALRGDAADMGARLLERSNGNALFLVHLIEAAADGAWTTLPDSIEDVVSRRMQDLSERARDAAAVAALAGIRFSPQVVGDVLGWDGATAREAIDELIDRRIVRAASGRAAADYAFAHQLVLEVVARNTSGEHAAERHRRIARVIEELYPERAEENSAELARHYDLGDDARNAVEHYAIAARRALSLAALDDAQAYVARALELTTDARRRVELLLARETLHGRRSQTDLQRAGLEEAWQCAEALDDEELRREILLRRVRRAQKAESDAHVMALLHEFRSRLRASGDALWHARVDLLEAETLDHAGTADEVERSAGRALAAFSEVGDPAGRARALGLLAVMESRRNDFERALAYSAQMQSIAEGANDYDVRRRAAEAAFMINGDSTQRARDAARTWLAVVTDAGDRQAEGYARDQLATTYVWDIDGASVVEARTQFAEAAAIFRQYGIALGLAAVEINSSYIEMKVGRFDQAVRATSRTLTHFEDSNSLRGVLISKSFLSEALALAGDAERAERMGADAVALAQTAGYALYEAGALEHLASAHVRAGNAEAAVDATTRAMALRESAGRPSGLARNLAILAHAHASAGDVRAARAAIERLPEDDDQLADRCLWPQLCVWTAARIYRACGEAARSAEALERAHALMARAASGLGREDGRYFRAIAWHRAIARAYDRGVWPAQTAR